MTRRQRIRANRLARRYILKTYKNRLNWQLTWIDFMHHRNQPTWTAKQTSEYKNL